MATEISQKQVDAFAQKRGYDYAQFSIHWKGYDVYNLYFKDNEIRYIGSPRMILVSSDGSMRMTTYEEGMEINHLFAQEGNP